MSRKKEAEVFQDWVTSEMLPTIRKHGAYMTEDIIQKTLSDPDYMIELFTNIKKEHIGQARYDITKMVGIYVNNTFGDSKAVIRHYC